MIDIHDISVTYGSKVDVNLKIKAALYYVVGMLHAFPHDTQANSQYKEGILDFEIRILLRCADGRVYRRRIERFSANCIQEVDRLGGEIVIM